MKTIRLFIIAGIIMAIPHVIKSQPAIQWQKSIGGSGAEYANKIIQTSDGGYFVAGYSESNDGDFSANKGNSDFAVARLNSSGSIIWQKLYGGSEDDEINDFVLTSDGGLVLVGSTNSYDGDVTGNHGSYSYDFWIVKIDTSGNIIWKYAYGGTNDDEANAVALNGDGSIIVMGSAYSDDGDLSENNGERDYWIIKLNSSGVLQWQKALGGSDTEEGYDIVPTQDGGYIGCGRSSSNDGDVTGNHGGADCWIVKLDASGNLEWQKSFGGTETEEANSILRNNDGSFTFLGYSCSNDGDVSGQHNPGSGNDDFWVVKINSTGTLIWQKCLGGNLTEQAEEIVPTSDGGYLLGGLATSTDGDVTGIHSGLWSPDYWVVKIDYTGVLKWQKCLGGSDQDEGLSITTTSDGGSAISGFSYSTDGDVTGHHSQTDWWIVKLGIASGIEENIYSKSVIVYPNPAEDYLIVENTDLKNIEWIAIYDIQGQIIEKQSVRQSTTRLNIGNLKKGKYILKINYFYKTEVLEFEKF